MSIEPRKLIVAATPVVAIIVSPTHSSTIPVVIPQQLGQDLRLRYQAENDSAARWGLPRRDFSEWLLGNLSTIAYGHGEEPGAALDWLERES